VVIFHPHSSLGRLAMSTKCFTITPPKFSVATVFFVYCQLCPGRAVGDWRSLGRRATAV
jgi:hypothetical protein